MALSNTFDTATPAGSDDPAEADDRMREIKAAVQERENVDHYWPLTGTEVSDADTGEHRKVTLRVGSAPSNVVDKGFVYAKDVGGKAELFYIDEDGNEIQLTSKGQNLANDTYLTGTDAAGTGSVNLIKAGTNDLATLPDSAEMASNAAPVEDEAVVNKKYVDDQIVTKGFFASGSTVFSISMTAATTFQDLDLSGIVGSNSAMVFLEIACSAANIVYICKPKGFGGAYAAHRQSQDTEGMGCCTLNIVTANEFGYVCVPTDSSGVIQHGSNENAGTYTIKLVGYVK